MARARSGRSGGTNGYDDAWAAFVSELRADDVRKGTWAASRMLLMSRIYKRMLRDLNRKYVWSGTVEKAGGPFDPPGGRFKAGRFAGRRMLTFSELTPGHRFIRGGSVEVQTSAFPLSDYILLSLPMADIGTDKRRGAFIADLMGSIAHETVHAHHRVTARPGPRRSRAKGAKAFIEEEIDTRKKERRILKEILSLKKGRRMALDVAAEKNHAAGVGAALDERIAHMRLAPAQVERDVASGTNLTYLELFVLDELITESIRVAKLDVGTVTKSVRLVGRLEFQRPVLDALRSDNPGAMTVDPESGLRTPFMSETEELLVVRRAADKHREESGGQNAEAIRRQHVEAFFPRDIRYTPVR